MTSSAHALPPGLYEHILTRDLESALAHLDPAAYAVTTLDAAAAHELFARHVTREVARALHAVRGDDATSAQLALVNALLARLAELASHDAHDADDYAPPSRKRSSTASKSSATSSDRS